jgi:hypothetical protein
LHHAIAMAFEDTLGLPAKLERVLSWAGQSSGAQHVALIDGLIADCLGSAAVVQDLLGRRLHLGAALAALTDLACGRPVEPSDGASASLQPLSKLLVEWGMPATRAVLLDRLQRELAGTRPLTHGDERQKRRFLDGLARQLRTPDGGFVGGGATVDALAGRYVEVKAKSGVVAVRFKASDVPGRIAEVLATEKLYLADNAKRGFAAYILELLDKFDGDPAELTGQRRAIRDSGLGDDAKCAILSLMPFEVDG